MPRTHRAYDEEFKRQAVELYLYSSNSLKQVARELGVSDGSLIFAAGKPAAPAPKRALPL